jgi:hypothetical protein
MNFQKVYMRVMMGWENMTACAVVAGKMQNNNEIIGGAKNDNVD